MEKNKFAPNPGYGKLCDDCQNQEPLNKGRAFPCREVIFDNPPRRNQVRIGGDPEDWTLPTSDPDKYCPKQVKRCVIYSLR